MKHLLLTAFWFLVATDQYLFAQPKQEDIYTDYVFYDKRVRLQKDLNENTIGKTFSGPLTPDNEHRFESACLAVSQFLLNNETISSGIRKMLKQYDSLGIDTRRALLEAVYASYPAAFAFDIQQIMQREKDPKLFAMCGVYLYRNHRTTEQANAIKLKMIESFPAYDTLDLLLALEEHLNDKHGPAYKPPPLKDLFEHQKKMNNKVIYSFQRWNRDYPGLAVVQNADGRFVRHPDGRLMVFEQLARSASGMPFFLTNGNTPQGIYSILGTGVSRNQFIGPTPNIQMVMPFEDPSRPFVHTHQREKEDIQMAYRQLLPDTWKAYAPMMESFKAGKIGRTAIIAHGSTLDPEYFRDRPFYPLTPTMGCLCAKELWNVTSGKLLISEQYNLYSAFTSTPGSKGYLIVVNLDDQQQPLSRAEIEKIIGK